jgi:hypothetical protein
MASILLKMDSFFMKMELLHLKIKSIFMKTEGIFMKKGFLYLKMEGIFIKMESIFKYGRWVFMPREAKQHIWFVSHRGHGGFYSIGLKKYFISNIIIQ